MKTVCFDFDGVIHSYKHGWKGLTEIPDEPVDVQKMKEEILKLMSYGYRAVIYSTRCKTEEGRKAIEKWLLKWGLYNLFDEICSDKPPAVVYVDDRGINFNGEWSGMADKIKGFESWLDRWKKEK